MTVSSAPYRVIEEEGQRTLEIDYRKSIISPSIEDKPVTMANIINRLLEVGPVTQIVFLQREDFIYDETQTRMLSEIVALLNDLMHRKNILSPVAFKMPNCPNAHPARQDFLRVLLMYELREDPIAAYVDLSQHLASEKHINTETLPTCPKGCHDVYLTSLNYIFSKLGATKLVQVAQPFLSGYKPGDREIYHRIFQPIIQPNFMYAKVATSFPPGATELDAYKIAENADVAILKVPGDIRPLYHITPAEFKLSEQKYTLLGEAREVLASHRPRKSEFLEPQRTRGIFFSVEKDLIDDMSKNKNIDLKPAERNLLASILVRYTIGFGVIEVLLSDPKIQDIAVNAPIGENNITIIHQKYGECGTNITITPREADSWATKLRMLSGRPLDEANPVLDTQLILPGAAARVAAIQRPLSPSGLAFAFRRHRDLPWTLPLFIKNKMITPLAAGLLSFAIDGARTMLVAGTRSAGKTSFLGAMMVEIIRSNRVIVVEDTLELPIPQFRKLKYDIQSMKVQSVITGGESEVSASEGIRASLRLGDSSLIVGEVRSKEAVALYEAMRVGALANVVAGTIHGDSPYSVFDRVVNDLGVPKTSFKATDLIIVANPVKSASGLEKERRIVQITEVRKEWQNDPLAEKAFVDLMVYNPKTDKLEATDALIQGESEVIKAVASRVREWAGDWDAVWNNIQLRANVKQEIVAAAEKYKRPDLLEAAFVVQSNDELHRISQSVIDDTGKSDSKRIFAEWKDWLKDMLKKEDKQ